MYYARPRRPEPAERETIAVMAHLAGIAIERQRDTRQRRALERRLLTQKTALVELAKSAPLDWNDFRSFAGRAVEAAAATLGLARVSVWRFNEDRSILRCEDLYELETDRHSSGLELESSGYPRYFAALERGRSVVAHDARRDPDTREFSESYLAPLGITSMLDAPIRQAGQLAGVVCHEHVGPARVWTPDEQDFAASVGDLISLAIASSERRRTQQSFRSAQEELLRQDFQARRQIEFELDRIKDELVRQTRMATIGQVAASIAHELRNPLGAIRNAAYCLRKQDSGDPATRNEYLAIIEQEIRRSDGTIDDLLEMSQAKAPNKQVVDLAKIVRDSFEYVRREGIDLETSFEPRPFLVDADPGQLRQVLTNVMSNSIDAMDDGGKIEVRVRREASFDVVLVKDDGSGIPSEVRARLFEPLVTTKAKGTGLGLPICRQIVERHGGTINTVDTDGKGAGFLIRLPRAAPE